MYMGCCRHCPDIRLDDGGHSGHRAATEDDLITGSAYYRTGCGRCRMTAELRTVHWRTEMRGLGVDPHPCQEDAYNRSVDYSF